MHYDAYATTNTYKYIHPIKRSNTKIKIVLKKLSSNAYRDFVTVRSLHLILHFIICSVTESVSVVGMKCSFS